MYKIRKETVISQLNTKPIELVIEERQLTGCATYLHRVTDGRKPKKIMKLERRERTKKGDRKAEKRGIQ